MVRKSLQAVKAAVAPQHSKHFAIYLCMLLVIIIFNLHLSIIN